MTEKRKYYLTTAIPYVNARPHLGMAFEYVQTDVIARHHRALGDDVFFLTGADENSLKNVQAAEAEGIPTAELVARNTGRFIELTRRLEISNDDFIRTVESKHHVGSQKLWSACRPEDIYKQKYQGLYCVGCEAFYTESELVDGKCPEHQRPPDLVEEENYFFRLSNYQERLERLIASDELRIVPEIRKNEILSFIRSGLHDFSISRSRERARDWGVAVPGDPSQVMYVWFDALSNYITALDYGLDSAADSGSRFARYWPADVHVIGKGIIRFHAVYWPAMLLSAGVPLPKTLFVHGYINLAGVKMSKSLGTVVDPVELIDKYGVEVVRYYLSRYIHPFQDSDFTYEQLEATYTADLAKGLGNLLSRSLTMIEKCGGTIPRGGDGAEDEVAIRALFAEIFTAYERFMADFEFGRALDKVWEGQAALDRYITIHKPWELAKNPARAGELHTVLYILAEGLRMLASLIAPVMPATATEIWRRLGLERPLGEVAWADHKRWGLLAEGLTVDKGAPLFPWLAK
ncbi:MAG: methionine--tRNA ligase [bacterium]|nr:methionine--tRNA ligase [bacterium]